MSKVWNYESNVNDVLSKKVDKDPDITYTKDEHAKYLISLIDFRDNDYVMEPCYGKGAFYKNLPNNTINKYCEINMGIDYLTQNMMVDITLSNPPFVPRKLFWSFHQKAMETTRREIYWLINISSLNVFTPKRMEECDNKGWYLSNLHITSDKRWFGRYVWCKFTKENNNFLSYSKIVF